MRFLARVLMLCLMPVLSSCYVSDIALITPENADWPLPDYAGYREAGTDAFGNIRREDTGYDRYHNATGIVRAVFTPPGERVSSLLFRRLAEPHYYIVQEFDYRAEPGTPSYRCDVVIIEVATVTVLNLKCDLEEGRAFMAEGLITREEENARSCSIRDLAPLETIFRYKLENGLVGEPTVYDATLTD